MRRGALNGILNVEFHALAERREGGLRVIERAELSGLALVDRGAYPQSVAEVRAGVELRAKGRGLSGALRLRERSRDDERPRDGGARARVEQLAPSVGSSGSSRSYRKSLNKVIGEAIEDAAEGRATVIPREVQLLAGPDYSGSRSRALSESGLRLDSSPDTLRFDVDRLPNLSYARDLLGALRGDATVFAVQATLSSSPPDVVRMRWN